MHNLHIGPELTEGVLAETLKTLENLLLLVSLHVPLHSQVTNRGRGGGPEGRWKEELMLLVNTLISGRLYI